MTEPRPIDSQEDVRETAARYNEALDYAGRFFMGKADSQLAAQRLSDRLRELLIPHAIAFGLAVGRHGHLRVTTDVDIILSADGLAAFKRAALGRGWVERFPGSKGLRDVVHNVDIGVLITGDFPGDGQPKPVAFPDPSEVTAGDSDTPVISLNTLLELKIACGMTAPHRLQDLADVIALIRCNSLPEWHGRELDSYVRAKFEELWALAQHEDEY